MTSDIRSITVIGGGTMGSGIAAACAAADRDVLVLEATRELAEAARARVTALAVDADEAARFARRLSVGTFTDDLALIGGSDWICEAVIEKLEVKRDLLRRLEPLRRDGSIVSTNTSGIPLHDILEGAPERLRRDTLVTHFFNPVRLMRLIEIVSGDDTSADAHDRLVHFIHDVLGKGVVDAKDTPNFIGNRIGCFWILAGLHKATAHRAAGLSIETIDALMSAPVGIPSTGLYGLVDLIGLDVMDSIARNLAATLPNGDVGRHFASLPAAEAAMLARGQLGRKSGGGYYRLQRTPEGGKVKEVYESASDSWSAARRVTLSPAHADLASLMFTDDAEGRFAWDLLGDTLCYAADLVPEISDDIVGIDRAMRWGFAWGQGPFELLDRIDPARFAARLRAEGRRIPHMLAVAESVGATRFYVDGTHLGTDGRRRPIGPE
ncbi:3-hydroxyacyl-CoA dehydrogenase family protein [Siculibacillus lacustris]|uniref:3-hydroxyacyl-CoA dehydrogenase family protein n=1 Tax=Siculibacillus lacustris TaxID=1549641 RepID=A0A4Q9VZY3_9HYPH|nr:3-hydroxyacyl-CoA dehydrogenase family protein [Siculibacillus lacustris]TBW41203.1 3-hydroxyacyl-CoA dehydrogenase family protein [Siculibacillus lacustris]